MFGRKSENRTLEVLLKIFLVIGIIAGICFVAKILLDKFKKKSDLIDDDDDFTCDFECLENDDLDGDCSTCIYNCASKGEEEHPVEQPEEEQKPEAGEPEAE